MNPPRVHDQHCAALGQTGLVQAILQRARQNRNETTAENFASCRPQPAKKTHLRAMPSPSQRAQRRRKESPPLPHLFALSRELPLPGASPARRNCKTIARTLISPRASAFSDRGSRRRRRKEECEREGDGLKSLSPQSAASRFRFSLPSPGMNEPIKGITGLAAQGPSHKPALRSRWAFDSSGALG